MAPVPVITYTVSDGSLTATATLSINVTAINDAPQAANDIATTNEDVPLTGNVLTNDTDVDGDTLTVTTFEINGTTYNADSTAEIAGKGSIVINSDGSYTFTPAANFNGDFPLVTYTVSDGSLTDTATLSINITAINDAPEAVDDAVTINENNVVLGNVLDNDSDVEGDTLTVTSFVIDGKTYAAGDIVNLPNIGVFVLTQSGSYSFTPAEGYSGVVPNVTYTVSDGSLTDTAILSFSIAAVNDPPRAQSETLSTNEDDSLTGNLLANDTDPEGDVLSISSFKVLGQTYSAGLSANLPGVGVLTIRANGEFSFIPVANFNGVVPVVEYTVSDGSLSAVASLNISVTSVNDLPIVQNETAITDIGIDVSGNVLSNDYDIEGQPLSISQFTIAGVSGVHAAGDTVLIDGVGSITLNADGTYIFDVDEGFAGAVPDITYTVSDQIDTTDGLLKISVNDPDSDGDGVSDAKELADETNPYDPCDYNQASQVLSSVSAAWLAADCDGDGLTNGEEATGVRRPKCC